MMNPAFSPNDWYLSQFDAFEKTLNGESKSELHTIRREAIDRFHSIGFPTTRNEEWRFTNIAAIAKSDFTPVLRSAPSEVTRAEVEKFSLDTRHLLVFVNGHFAPDCSNVAQVPPGVVCGSLASAVRASDPNALLFLTRQLKIDETPFVSLNTAFLQDGAFIFVPDDKAMEDSIQLLFIVSEKKPSLVSPRNLIVVGKRSRLSIVESYVSLTDQSYLTNAVTEIVVGDESVVEHDKLQNESLQAFHVAMTQTRLGAKAQFTSNSIAIGGSIVRNNVTVVLDAERSECTLNGLSLAAGAQVIDNHTVIDHAKPNCASHELYKAILDGKSRGVFNGKIFVRADAQKTDAKQTNKTLLLSDQATVDTKPQLEIFADDVKCTHGATVGQLDADQVFYLRTRGIGETAAKDILTFAFAGDVVSRVHIEPLRRQLESLINDRLYQGRLVQPI
jgi:Fe-S cluster assembly protein SufD